MVDFWDSLPLSVSQDLLIVLVGPVCHSSELPVRPCRLPPQTTQNTHGTVRSSPLSSRLFLCVYTAVCVSMHVNVTEHIYTHIQHRARTDRFSRKAPCSPHHVTLSYEGYYTIRCCQNTSADRQMHPVFYFVATPRDQAPPHLGINQHSLFFFFFF